MIYVQNMSFYSVAVSRRQHGAILPNNQPIMLWLAGHDELPHDNYQLLHEYHRILAECNFQAEQGCEK